MSGAAFPLIVSGQAVGVMFFISSEKDTFTPEFAELLQRLTDNVSHAIGTFDRADEKARTEVQKERLTRMLAALSATNEAIIRATSRAELFQLVCEAAAKGGKFTLTSIMLIEQDRDFLDVVATAGTSAASALQVKVSANEALPEGHGLTGRAIRSRQACISNDYLADQSVEAFHGRARSDGANSGAAFPLFVQGQVVGIMIFISIEKNTFTPEFAELLLRLVGNVSFALENFDRADDKARTEVQKERLTRMLAALSATNEAIIRASSRAELFDLVCEAAANGGKFTLTSIALIKSDSAYLDVVAAAGPTASSARQATISASEAHPEGRGLCGSAIRSQQACIINDYLADPRAAAFHDTARNDGTNSGASFPLWVHGQVFGVMSFMSMEKDTFTPEFAELLQRLVDNVSFALENFDRADEKTKADERIEYLASHDSLTKLPNREMFNGMLRRTIDAAARYQRQFALLFIDLDRFKVINDSLGHDAGDMLLVEIGGRLRRALRTSDVVARLGGDEFVVILEETAERPEVERIAGELLSVLSQPLQFSGHECHTTASIGIAMYPSDGTDVQTLTKNADMAMYLAKEDGKNGFRFFTKEFKTQSIERLTLESALRRALERDQFSLHYQPKIDMASGQITGVEALLRWNHPDLGTTSAGSVHSAGRGNRADRSDRPLGAQGSLRAEHGLATPRPAAGDDGGQPFAAAIRRRAPAARCRRGAAGERHVAGTAAARGYRKHGDAKRVARDQGARCDPEPRHSPCDRRLRHRLFVDVADEAVPDRHHQDRPLLRSRSADRFGGPGHRPGDHQHGQGAWHDRHCGGCRDRGAGGLPAQPRLRRDAGFPVLQAAAGKADG